MKNANFQLFIGVYPAGVSYCNKAIDENGNMYGAAQHTVGVGSNGVPKRMYMNVKLPDLPRNPRIKKAELKFFVQFLDI